MVGRQIVENSEAEERGLFMPEDGLRPDCVRPELEIVQKALEQRKRKKLYYEQNKERILAQKREYWQRTHEQRLAYLKAHYQQTKEARRKDRARNRSLRTARHRIWREKQYEDPVKAAAYRKYRRESVLRSLWKRAGYRTAEKGHAPPMLGTGYVPPITSFIEDPERAIRTTYSSFGLMQIFRIY